MLVENNTYPQDVRVRSEAQSLVNAGHQVTVIVQRGEGQPRRERVRGVRVRRFTLPKTSASPLGYVLEYAVANARLYLAGAWQLCRGAEVIHLHNPPDTLFGIGFLARALGRHVVFDHHDLAPELFEAKFGRSPVVPLLRLLEWLSFRCASMVIAPNESHRDIALKRGAVPAERIAVVRIGPPRTELDAATDPREGVLVDPHLLFLGFMEHQDGVDDLVPMFEDVVHRRGFPQARLTLVGQGSRRVALAEKFAAAGLSEQVHFTGFVPHGDVASLLAEADICVDPAPCTPLNDHSTMVKVAEYMAARRPVVCYPLLETKHTAGDAAAFAECGDATSLAEQIAALARDPERRLKLAHEGYKRAGDLTWDASEAILLSAFERLGQQPGLPERPLRVLWVTNMWPTESSWQGIFVAELAEAMRRRPDVGVDVEIIVREGRGRGDYLKANRRIRRKWQEGNYDLVHAHYGLTAAATMALPPGAPLVVTYHGQDINYRVGRTISRITGRRAKRRIFVADTIADQWPSPRNRVLSCGVDFDLFAPTDRATARAALHLDPDRSYVLFGGAPDNPRKNYSLFQAVLKRVTATVPDATELILAVDGQPRTAVPQRMLAADVFLFTSKPGREGAPTVFREAMAVGLPIVTLDVGDARELLGRVRPGAVVPLPAGYTGDGDEHPEALVTELAGRVIEALKEGRRSDGRDHVSHLQWSRIAEKTVEIYREAILG